MILLSDEHEKVFLDLISTNPHLYLFFMGDYLAYGFNHPDCNFYGEFKDDKLSSCLMRYKDSIHLSGESISSQGLEFMYDLFEKKNCQMIHCSENYIDSLLSSPISFKVDISLLSVYNRPFEEHEDEMVSVLNMADVDEFINVVDLGFKIHTNRDDFIDDHLQGRMVSYCLKKDGKIVSVASVTARTPSAAMIIGVATLLNYENSGYASRVIKYLCNDLMKDGTATVLFYTNEVAGKVYHRCGFVDQTNYYLLKRVEVLG